MGSKVFFHLPLNRMLCCMQLMEFYWLKKEWHFPSSYTNYHSVIVLNLKWRKARRRRHMMNQKCMNTNLHFKLCSQFFLMHKYMLEYAKQIISCHLPNLKPIDYRIVCHVHSLNWHLKSVWKNENWIYWYYKRLSLQNGKYINVAFLV